ncbi:MAG: hypothetical protein BWY83_01902 [bacterium ADurb.Bin478]|nr:MAG: hypothetical protein BWY83_01902 [bacterium ADurb.Bin478]
MRIRFRVVISSYLLSSMIRPSEWAPSNSRTKYSRSEANSFFAMIFLKFCVVTRTVSSAGNLCNSSSRCSILLAPCSNNPILLTPISSVPSTGAKTIVKRPFFHESIFRTASSLRCRPAEARMTAPSLKTIRPETPFSLFRVSTPLLRSAPKTSINSTAPRSARRPLNWLRLRFKSCR